MDYELRPPAGVGPLVIGMPREAADQALLHFRDLAAISDLDQAGRFIFRPSGLMISIHSAQGELQAIELGRPVPGTDTVSFQGIDVFGLPAQEVVRQLSHLTTVDADPEDPASFVAPDLLLSFWRPFAADDEPDEEQGYYFSSVLVARPGYYDTPAQGAARAALCDGHEANVSGRRHRVGPADHGR